MSVFKKSIFYEQFTKIFLKVILLWILFAVFEGAGVSLLYPIIELIQFNEIKKENFISDLLSQIFSHFNLKISLVTLSFLTFFIISIRFFIYYFKNKVVSKSVHQIESNLRNKLINVLYNSKLYFLIDKKDGEWTSSFSYDVVRARNIMNDLCDIIGNLFLLLIYVFILSLISFKLFLYCLPIFLTGLLILKNKSKFFEESGAKISKKTSDYLSIHEDVMKNIIFVKMRGILNSFEKKLKQESKDISFYQYFLNKQNFKIESIFGFILLIGVFYILLIAKLKLSLDLFEIAIFLFVLNRVTPCLQTCIKASLNFLVNFQSFRKIIELIEKAENNREKLLGKKVLDRPIQDIFFENVSFTYDNREKHALKNINLDLSYGQSLGIIGQSGSGKSTLLNILTGFYSPISGNIKINKKKMNELNLLEFRKKISYLPQNPELLNDSIINNLVIGNKRRIEKKEIKKVIKECYSDFIFDLPDGLNTIVGDRGLMLSGGQRQRLVIARAILNNSELLILDEATNGLDENSEKKIIDTLFNLKSKLIQIISSHRISTIENTDKLIYLVKGKIKYFGKTKILLKKPDIKAFFNKREI